MKKKFLEYYQIEEASKIKILKEGILIFDASALLNLYQYSLSTIESILKVVKDNRERIWLPYQFAFEYQKNRLKAIRDQSIAYEKAVGELENSINNLTSKTCVHPFLDIDKKAFSTIGGEFKKIKEQLEKYKKDNPIWYKEDTILEQITDLYANKVGDEYTADRLDKIFQEGEIRYDKKIPPGYMDALEKKNTSKNDPNQHNQFGDLIGWFQILDKAREDKKPVIFVVDDIKEDWWRLVKEKRRVSPNVKLIKEFKEKTGQDIIFFTMDRFSNTVDDFNIDAKKEIQEIRELEIKKETLEIKAQENIFINDSLTAELPTSEVIAPVDSIPAATSEVIAPVDSIPAATSEVIAPVDSIPAATSEVIAPNKEEKKKGQTHKTDKLKQAKKL